ncbi:MAG: FAD binding domain-containing protein [Dehalococcoidia bacterium]
MTQGTPHTNGMTDSHILVREFEYLEPASVEEAVALLSRYGDRARVLAGGTDLVVQMKMERLAPEYLISLRKVSELDGIVFQQDGLRIGAGTTIRAIRDDAKIKAWYPALAEACAAFSTTQVQVMGTIGGNLCNASPAADCAPALIACGADVVVTGAQGERRLPLEELFLGPGRTALRAGELLVAVVLERPRPGTGSTFLKVSRVAADIAKVNAAVMLVREGNRIVDARLAFGSVAPTPLRVQRAEAVLVGRTFAVDLVAEAARVASEEVTPIDDVRSTAWYRREIVRVLAHDGMHTAWERAGQEQPAEFTDDRGPASPAGHKAASSAAVRLTAREEHRIELTVNGEKRRIWVASNDLLLNVLREDLELTGAKYGCGIGECGACTVQMDGKPVVSCLVLAVAANGSDITTVEGLRRPNGDLDPLQDAFIEHTAFQCGYCTPGILMVAKSLLRENPHPTEGEVRDYLKGSFCRCTGYTSIVRAVMRSAGVQTDGRARR